MTRRHRLLPFALLVGLVAAACGGTSATPGPSAAPTPSPVVSDAPEPSSAPPSEAPPSEAPPTDEPPAADAGGPYAEALVAALASDPLMMHIEQVATATTAIGSLEATLSGDISGSDLAIVMHLSAAGTEVDSEMVVLGDTAFIREGADGEWQSAPSSIAEAQLAGLLQNMRLVSDPQDLLYVGRETVDGRDLHHLTASRTIPYAPAAGGTGQYDMFDIWIEEDGTPVLAKTAFSASDEAGNSVTGTTNFEFSNFGGPIDIVAPSVRP